MSVDFEKLQSSMTAANDTQKRAVLSSISDSTDPRAKKLLETLAQDKNTAIKMLASSYLKKNFSDTAAASVQNHGSHAAVSANSSANGVQPISSSSILDKFSGFDFQKILGPDFLKIFVVPFGFIIVAGLFSPVIPPFFFLAAYFGLIIAVSLAYDLNIAIILVSVVCVFSMVLHSVGLIVNFRPTIYLLSLFFGSGIAISMVTTSQREKLLNSKAANDEFKSQIMQMKKLIDKKKDFDETQRDMDQVTKMKNELTAKSRRLNETLIQIHEIISNQKTDEIVERVTKLLTRQLGAKSVSIWVVNTKFHSVYPVGFSEKHISPQKYSNMNIPTDEETIITKVAREGGFYTADDFKKISEYEPFSKEFDIKSEFCVSMDAGNRVIGAINCEEVGETFEFGDEVKKLIKLIADVSAWALKNAGDLELSKRDLQNIKQISDKDREEKKKIRDIFDKFVSPKVIEEIMNNPASLALGGKRRAITLFFADIRGFT
ncbi:MAG TPA: GAF domain-containing protein, partial [Candidatus Wallbacteria bacterium]|nr:GAF domain-containing protein [Candidatus Wallbacteria bacterium]